MKKHFKLAPDQIRSLAPGRGSCFASDRITVDGQRVGYLYREKPDDAFDSGWRMFSGDESQAYVEDSANLGIYEVNTIVNYYPDIIPLLDSAVGTRWGRDEEGEFQRE